jgi:adenosylmethionine-8-amino-7-oxononanoate aminotransferase
MGEHLKTKLESLKSHRHVGDVRGKGLMVGIEFVKDKETKQPFEPATNFSVQVAQECLKRGMFIEYSGGCDRGQAGDMIMLGPPFIITKKQIDEAVSILNEVLMMEFSASAGLKGRF